MKCVCEPQCACVCAFVTPQTTVSDPFAYTIATNTLWNLYIKIPVYIYNSIVLAAVLWHHTSSTKRLVNHLANLTFPFGLLLLQLYSAASSADFTSMPPHLAMKKPRAAPYVRVCVCVCFLPSWNLCALNNCKLYLTFGILKVCLHILYIPRHLLPRFSILSSTGRQTASNQLQTLWQIESPQ